MITIDDMKKNQKMYAIVGAVLVVVAIGVGVFIMQGKSKTTSSNPAASQEVDAITMKPEDIGLTLEATPSNHEVIMKMSDLSKFNSFEFEMNYEAIENGQTVLQGASGSGDVKSGENTIERKITIGTCSTGGACKFHQGVKKITFIIRLNLKDGKIGSVQKDLEL